MKKTLTLLASFVFLLVVSFTFTKLYAAAPTKGDDVTITLNAYFDNTNKAIGQDSIIVKYASGRQIAFGTDIEGTSGYSFAYWIVNGHVQPSLAYDHSFKATTGLELTAVFYESGVHAVVFADANGKVFKNGADYVIQYVANGGSATAPSTSGYSKPGYVVSSTPWGVSLENITSSRIAYLQYTLDNSATLNLSLTGGSSAKSSYAYNEVATITANAASQGQYFKYWEDGSQNVISIEAEYSFTMLTETSLTAVFGTLPVGDVPFVSLKNLGEVRTGYNTFVANMYIPSDYTLIEYGMLSAASGTNITFETSGVTRNQGNRLLAQTGEWIMSISTSNTVIRAYVACLDKLGNLFVAYDGVGVKSPLIIYEVYGGGGQTNAPYTYDYLVLFNLSKYDIDLTNITVQYASATGTSWNKTPALTSLTILSKKFFLIQQASGGTAGTSLPTPDAIGNVAMQASNFKYALVNSTTALSVSDPTSNPLVLDFIGTGTANASEGSVATGLVITASLKRNKLYDSNINSADFSAGTPNLQYIIDSRS